MSWEASWGILSDWLGEIAALIGIFFLFNVVVKRIFNTLKERFSAANQIGKASFIEALYFPLSYTLWTVVAIQICDFLIVHTLGAKYFFKKSIVMQVVIVLGGSWFLMRWKNKIVKSYSASKIQPKGYSADAMRIDVFDKLATVAILCLTVMLVLEVTENNWTTLIAFSGISGLALAFASQEVISSFFGGLMIYITQPFRIEDWIILPDKNIEGHVEEIGWYITKVRTLDKRPIYVPNAIFSKIVVVNPSRMTHRRLKETIGLRYADLDKLKSIISEIDIMLKSHPDIDHTMNSYAYFSAFGSSSLDLVLSAYTRATKNEAYNRVKEKVLFAVADIVSQHQAEFAYPTTCIDLPQSVRLQFDTPSKGMSTKAERSDSAELSDWVKVPGVN